MEETKDGCGTFQAVHGKVTPSMPGVAQFSISDTPVDDVHPVKVGWGLLGGKVLGCGEERGRRHAVAPPKESPVTLVRVTSPRHSLLAARRLPAPSPKPHGATHSGSCDEHPRAP